MTLMPTVPILFVRYAPGACGTFLIALLSASNQTCCWDPTVDAAKESKDFPDIFLQWFKQKFTHNLQDHLKHEPHHPYKIDFFSAKHPRGDDITVTSFLHMLKDRDDIFFLQNIQQNKKTMLRLNKSIIPKFGYGNDVINIHIDPASQKWLHRTRYVKLFGHDGDNYQLKEHHPEYLQAKNYTLRFHNPYLVQESHYKFMKNYVICDPTVELMRDRSRIINDPSNSQCRQHWINLSQLINIESAVNTVMALADTLQFTLDINLVDKCCRHYHDTNVAPILECLQRC